MPSLYLKVIQPALYEIGRLWEQGRLGVTQEHLATTISRLALAQLYPHLACRPENGKLALVACVEGEFHELGAHMMADLLEMAGFDVRFLGANVPTSALMTTVRAESPQLVVLSATLTTNIEALRRAIAAVRDAARSRVVLAAGGQASPGSVLPRVGCGHGRGIALDAIAAARRLLRSNPPDERRSPTGSGDRRPRARCRIGHAAKLTV